MGARALYDCCEVAWGAVKCWDLRHAGRPIRHICNSPQQAPNMDSKVPGVKNAEMFQIFPDI